MPTDIFHRDRSTDIGLVRINNEAIMTIASIAAMEVKGVYKMGGGIKNVVSELFFRKSGIGGVKINVHESEIRLSLSIIVEYGSDIPRVADAVQDSVKHALEKMTGLLIAEVDVVIEGVHAQWPNMKKNGQDR